MSVNLGTTAWRAMSETAGAKITGVHESLLQESEKDVLCDGSTYKAIVRSDQGCDRLSVPANQVKVGLFKKLFGIPPSLGAVTRSMGYLLPADKLKLAVDPNLPTELLAMEERQVIRSYKLGIEYCKAGQTTEAQILMNTHEAESEKYKNFLAFLGESITLSGWRGYRAGLDVSGSNNTGTTSVYTKWQGYEVMFHVATLLPFKPEDPQQLERKRHIGNDLVVIVFQEGDAAFDISSISSHQNHVIAFVRPHTEGWKLQFVYKDGVPAFTPELPQPCIIGTDNVSRDFFFHKLVNAERAIYRAPSFAPKLARTRSVLLNDIATKYRDFQFNGTSVSSISVMDFQYTTMQLPITARGLFVCEGRIVARGYDKFFNVGETPGMAWSELQERGRGPFQVSVKENGCIILVSSINGALFVTSKHAIGNPHSQVGQRWLLEHLRASGKSPEDLVAALGHGALTAVFELVDDEFEEHVLEYPPGARGLWLHGINLNTPEFNTWDRAQVSAFAREFGFYCVDCVGFESLDQVRQFADSASEHGMFNGRYVEGFVVRCNQVAGNPLFFKIKLEVPYLMFREWREVTRALLDHKQVLKIKYKATENYIEWVQKKIHFQPELFSGYLQNKGIINVRNLFLHEQAPVLGDQSVIDLAKRLADDLIVSDSGVVRVTDGGSSKTLIIPIAVIASGKTTLARTLQTLFPKFGHVQNDNIKAKRAAEAFERAVMQQFATCDCVFADRNNHLFKHRESLTKTFKDYYPKGRIVALNWNIDSYRKNDIIGKCIQRVTSRGENHQSLTPGRTKNFAKIIRDFVYTRRAYDSRQAADALIDTVVHMEFEDSVEAHVLRVCRELGWNLPSEPELGGAVAQARSFTETFVKSK